MKLTTGRPVVFAVVLVMIVVVTVSGPVHAKKKEGQGNQSSTNNAAVQRPVYPPRTPVQNSPVNLFSQPAALPAKKPQPASDNLRKVDDPVPKDAKVRKQTENSDPGNFSKHPFNPVPTLKPRLIPNGVEKTTAAGIVRERIQKHPDGERREFFTPTGRKEHEEVARSDGTIHRQYYNPGGKVNREEIVHTDGSREVSNQQWGRDHQLRIKETVQYNSNRKAVSKTVEKTVIVRVNNTTRNTVIVNHYDAGPYGFVYRPAEVRPEVFVAWYDPYWYGPDGVPVYHPFRYNWGWDNEPWYQSSHGTYWTTYDEYPAPSYWVTDRVMADYMADHYQAQVTPDQVREEIEQARADADQAGKIAQHSEDAVEIAQAKIAQEQAELREKKAEEKLALLERDAANPHTNATPVDTETKQAIHAQVESYIAEDKQRAELVAKGETPAPASDISKSLADPQHVYLVSSAVSVTLATDSSPAGMLSEGDALKLGPDQGDVVKGLTETTLLTMRVMSSKGEEGEVAAGALIQMPVTQLQEDENTAHANTEVAAAEASDRMGIFKRGGREE